LRAKERPLFFLGFHLFALLGDFIGWPALRPILEVPIVEKGEGALPLAAVLWELLGQKQEDRQGAGKSFFSALRFLDKVKLVRLSLRQCSFEVLCPIWRFSQALRYFVL